MKALFTLLFFSALTLVVLTDPETPDAPEAPTRKKDLFSVDDFEGLGEHVLAYSKNPHKDLTVAERLTEHLEKTGEELDFQKAIQSTQDQFVHPLEPLFPYGVPYGKDFVKRVKAESKNTFRIPPGATEINEDGEIINPEILEPPKVDEEYKEYLSKHPLKFEQFIETNFTVTEEKKNENSSRWDFNFKGEFDPVQATHNKYVREFQKKIVEDRDLRLAQAEAEEKAKTVFTFVGNNGKVTEIPYVDKETDIRHANFLWDKNPKKGDTKILTNYYGEPVAAVRKKAFFVFA